MDSILQRAALTRKSKLEDMLTPQQKAEAARLRIQVAMENLSHRRRLPFYAGFALVGGFLVGYSPQFKRLLMDNIAGVLRFVTSFKF